MAAARLAEALAQNLIFAVEEHYAELDIVAPAQEVKHVAKRAFAKAATANVDVDGQRSPLLSRPAAPGYKSRPSNEVGRLSIAS